MQTESISSEQHNAFSEVLLRFSEKTRCSSVVLATTSGLVLSQFSNSSQKTTKNNFTILTALAAANFSATTELAKLIGERAGFKLHFHEGEQHSVYLTTVGPDHLLIVIFSKDSNLGMIKLAGSSSVQELDSIINTLPPEQATPDLQSNSMDIESSEFCDELSAKLDSILSLNSATSGTKQSKGGS